MDRLQQFSVVDYDISLALLLQACGVFSPISQMIPTHKIKGTITISILYFSGRILKRARAHEVAIYKSTDKSNHIVFLFYCLYLKMRQVNCITSSH